MARTAGTTFLAFLVLIFAWTVHAKPTQAGPCIDCIQEGTEHTQPASNDVTNDVTVDNMAARPGDVEELMHQGEHVHGHGKTDSGETTPQPSPQEVPQGEKGDNWKGAGEQTQSQDGTSATDPKHGEQAPQEAINQQQTLQQEAATATGSNPGDQAPQEVVNQQQTLQQEAATATGSNPGDQFPQEVVNQQQTLQQEAATATDSKPGDQAPQEVVNQQQTQQQEAATATDSKPGDQAPQEAKKEEQIHPQDGATVPDSKANDQAFAEAMAYVENLAAQAQAPNQNEQAFQEATKTDTANLAQAGGTGSDEGHRQVSEEEVRHSGDPHVSESQQQYQAGDLEKLVHGDDTAHVHSQHQEERAAEGIQGKAGTVDMEHLMHAHDAEGDVHAHGDHAGKGEFKAGDVEQIVHGDAEGHVHEVTADQPVQGQDQGSYQVGDVDILGTFSVHDPQSREQVAMAGDLDQLMGTGGGAAQKEEAPTVVDTEHLMHGEGGHDHDVGQLKFLKTKEEEAAKDPFSDVHNLVMHADEHGHDHGHDDDSKIERGKTITYKDIMDLGLDEDMLKGVDVKKLLEANAKEYDDWQREKNTIKGESPEFSFWEQIGELRKRYLSFGRNDGRAQDLTGTKLDPKQQKWVEKPDIMEGKAGDEDSILHQMEMLGNTGARQDRHKHTLDDDYQNGRDVTDL